MDTQPNPQNLIWIDLEMTGLDPQQDRILEIATIVTDAQLQILAEGPVIAIHQEEALLSAMDAWNTEHHTNSGLLDRVRNSDYDEATAARETQDFLAAWVPEGASPMCGNSICQDRRFMVRLMPTLEAYFHYRNLDVSSVKELVRRWAPEHLDGFKKRGIHLALDDIRDSIAELAYYRETVFSI
ncbi:MAG TPA: oligoribonuclease [Gammaproteobacteria bacterium]|jgi:oligoribonuclease|nr:oligoribonuclease [Gammaproteobacteria bacterium]